MGGRGIAGTMGDGGAASALSSLGGRTGGFGATEDRFKGGGRGRGLKEFRLVVFGVVKGGPVVALLLIGGVDKVRDDAGGRLKSAADLGASL